MSSLNNNGGFPFGQTEPLTVRLRGLIHNYPKGIGIIKEFIQNADDAGANFVKIIMDWRTHPAKRLPAPEMQTLMGPALLIFNDKQFTKADLQGIQDIGQGGEKSWNVFKTGRFGLGFNASYNITDYPSFLTDEGIYFFDPHARVVAGATTASPGQGWHLNHQVWSDFGDMLKPFEVVDLSPDQNVYPYTVFRLPLRTEEHALRSEICKEPFTDEDFRTILQQLTDLGPELLLFLKHVLSIEVLEITQNSNEPRLLLRLTTENSDQVEQQRQVINDAIIADPAEMLTWLSSNTDQLPRVSYQHNINLVAENREERQRWRVVSGLYVDPDQEILEIMEKMLAQGEKAIPWAGAATKLEDNSTGTKDKMIRGRVYCFLPLTGTTQLPVHLNGFFDIDSSRLAPTSGRSVVGKDAVRVNWNEQIVEHCVARAYADLIEALVDDTGKNNPRLFYKYWPKIDPNLSGVLENLAIHVYRHLQSRRVIRSAGPQTWCEIGDVYCVPEEWRSIQTPLIYDQMPIPDPELPLYILDGFSEANVYVDQLTPERVRDHLRIDYSFDCPLHKVERKCLRRRGWLLHLLRYCRSDNWERDLRGVPLALMADGTLQTFGYFETNEVYLAGDEERKLFASHPEWFIDQEYAAETGLSQIQEIGLVEMTLERVVQKLIDFINPDGSEYALEWNPDSSDPPNAQWLQAVYEYLASRGSSDFGNLKELPFVPDQFGRLHFPRTMGTPLLPPADITPELKQALTTLGIPLVTGPRKLVKTIRDFVNTFPNCIWPLTAVGDFVDTLHAYSDDWTTKITEYQKDIHNPILNYLADATDLKDYPDRVKLLRTLPILPTLNNQLVTASTENIYIPAGEEPPIANGDIKLLKTGPRDRWRELLKTLSVPEFDLPKIILKVIIPTYNLLANNEKYQALRYIRENLQKASSQLEDNGHNTEEFWNEVSAAALVICTDGKSYPASKTYHPDSHEIVRGVLGPQAPIPDMDYYQDGKLAWLKFFSTLGMAESPRAEDLISYIDSLISQATAQGVEQVANHLLNVFEHIRKHWEELTGAEDERTRDDNWFIETLRSRAWLPAQSDEKNLRRYPGYVVPENRLYQPNELYMPRHGHLIASQKPIIRTAEPSRNIQTALGFPVSPEVELVIAHFDKILDLWHAENHSGLLPEDIERSLGQIYFHFGNLLDDEAKIGQLRTHYKAIKSLWHPVQQKFWLPQHVFDTPIPYFEPRRTHIHIKQSNEDQGYIALGRRETPEIEDYIEFIEELANEFGTTPLGENEVEQVIRVFSFLGQALEAKGERRPNIRVLTKDNFLIKASNVYEADAPWYVERFGADSPIFLLHDRVTRDIIEVAEIPSLSEHVEEKIVDQPIPSNDETARKWCQTWQYSLRSTEFLMGLIRLMRHFDKTYRSGDLDWLADTKVVAVTKIETELSVRGIDLGIGEAEYYFDPGTSESACTIYLTIQQQRLMEIFLANALNQQLDHAHLDDLSPLTAILSVLPEKIDGMLTKLRIQKPQIAPQADIFSEGEEVDDGFEFPTAASDDDRFENIQDVDDRYAEAEKKPGIAKPQVSGAKDQSTDNNGSTKRPPAAPPSISSPGSKSEYGDEGLDHQPTSQTGTGAGVRPGSRPKPPTKSRDQDKQPRSQDRSSLPQERPHGISYVESQNDRNVRTTSDGASTADPELIEIERVAVDIALAYEYIEGRRPVEKERTNKGYDIESYEPDSAATILNRPGQGKLARIIEVKGTKSPWDNYGVYLTPAELDEAKKRGDQYYLYVVEYALHPDHRKLYIIANPAQKIKEYRFDKGWKNLAYDLIEDTRRLLREGNRAKDEANVKNRGAVIKYFKEKGFGFLNPDDFPDGLFFHKNQIKGDNQVQIGDVFEFDLGQNKQGSCAINLRRV